MKRNPKARDYFTQDELDILLIGLSYVKNASKDVDLDLHNVNLETLIYKVYYLCQEEFKW